MRERDRVRSGFTLIELLVVIAVIGILTAILVPALGKVRSHANETACLSNLRQVNLALVAYANEDRRTRYPLEPTEHNSHPGRRKPGSSVISSAKGGSFRMAAKEARTRGASTSATSTVMPASHTNNPKTAIAEVA